MKPSEQHIERSIWVLNVARQIISLIILLVYSKEILSKKGILLNYNSEFINNTVNLFEIYSILIVFILVSLVNY